MRRQLIIISAVVMLAVCVYSQDCKALKDRCNNSQQCCSKYCASRNFRCDSAADKNGLTPCSIVRCAGECVVEDRWRNGAWKPSAVCIPRDGSN